MKITNFQIPLKMPINSLSTNTDIVNSLISQIYGYSEQVLNSIAVNNNEI